MTARDRPPHHGLNGFHAPAAIPARYKDLHPPHPVSCSRPAYAQFTTLAPRGGRQRQVILR